MRFLKATLVVLLASCANQQKTDGAFKLDPAPAGVLTAGVVASTGTPEANLAQAKALAGFVKSATGKETRPVVFPTYELLADAVAKGQADVAVMPPLAYVRTEGKAQLLGRVTRNGQGTYRSVVFAPAGGAVKSLEDLKKAQNLKVAWVDPSSATGYILPKALLVANQIDPAGVFVSQDFLSTHDAMCKGVQEGRFDLGATFSDDPASGPATHATGCVKALGEAGKALVIVGATGNIPNDALAVAAAFPADLRDALAKAAEALPATDEGKKTLSAMMLGDGFAPVTDEDYAPVRAAIESFRQ